MLTVAATATAAKSKAITTELFTHIQSEWVSAHSSKTKKLCRSIIIATSARRNFLYTYSNDRPTQDIGSTISGSR